jgi:TusA-related sulfurtransferase
MQLREIFLDVSELEAPQPLVQIVEALGQMDANSYLKIIHRMRPCRLYDILKQKNLCETTIEKEGVVTVYVYGCSHKEALWFLRD